MAKGTGSGDLLAAIREVQSTSAMLAATGIFLGTAPASDPVPYFLNAIYKPGKGRKRLSGQDADRKIFIEMKAVAQEENGVSGFEIAQNLADANYVLWTEVVGGLTPKQRLNAALNPLGWGADMPLEQFDIGPYYEFVNHTRRDHTGHVFLFVIHRI